MNLKHAVLLVAVAGTSGASAATVGSSCSSDHSPHLSVTNSGECADAIDNDSDGQTDYPADPDCDSPDDFETLDPPPECSDSIDNDSDALIDWPQDPGCSSRHDSVEGGPPACSDGLDNDGDGMTDFPADSNCSDVSSSTENLRYACNNGLDDDGDNLVDFGSDPGCHAANDGDETDVSVVDVRTRLLFAVETSGAMNGNACDGTFTGGDGSRECPGADVSCAVCSEPTCDNAVPDDSKLFTVKTGLMAALEGDVATEAALARMYQRPQSFTCATAAPELSSGGWQGAGTGCGGGFADGEVLVSFSPGNRVELNAWLDGETNAGGLPDVGDDFELRGSGTAPVAAMLARVHASLTSARSEDPQAACRPYAVTLITGSVDGCGADPAVEAAALRSAGIPVYVVALPGSPEAREQHNAIAAAGGTTAAFVVSDAQELRTAIEQIISAQTLVEQCNGVDDDCDSMIDEGFDVGASCTTGVGQCEAAGTKTCSADGTTTTCDAVEGAPAAELCNDADDDCDGNVDNGFDLGTPCTTGVGGCATAGVVQCASDGGTECSAAAGTPAVETCNGVDDSCDGAVDEGFGVGGSCSTGTGECAASGTTVCAADGGATCDASPGEPQPERCNDLDDDCDGRVDNGVCASDAGTDGGASAEADAGREDAGNGGGSLPPSCGCSSSMAVLPWALLALAACARRTRLPRSTGEYRRS